MSSVLGAITTRPAKNPSPSLAAPRSTSWIYIFHPSAKGKHFLALRALPLQLGSKAVGVPTGLVLDSCSVVAYNKRGELRTKGDPPQRVVDNNSNPDGLLIPGDYVFVVVDNGVRDEKYPLCPSFAAWKAPATLPDCWMGGKATDDTTTKVKGSSRTDASASAKRDDQGCLMTGDTTRLQASHLLPKSEAEWFDSQADTLQAHGADADTDLDSVFNLITLRADLNGPGFDQGLFLFAPCARKIISLFVTNEGLDLAVEYHLRAVNFLQRILRIYLFSRFTWNIFQFSTTKALVKIAASIDSQEESGLDPCPDGEGSKRKLAHNNNNNTSPDPKKARTDVGGSTGDGADSKNTVSTEEDNDEALIARYQLLDAQLQKRKYLTKDDMQAGRYPGFSEWATVVHGTERMMRGEVAPSRRSDSARW
ncbi:hypothetical protein C8F01DRAFT_1247169 [Mycena amicta]|nr:hypothetical protein C8F01DRAFT_1247169 [Mycena amicta]